MRLRPAKQEKPTTTPKTKRGARRTQRAAQRPPKQETAPARSAEPIEATPPPPPSLLVPTPSFVRRDITAPDGSVRPGWEMWIGDHCFGRADSKELLLASFQRLQSPPESFHWREVRNRLQMRGRPRTVQPEPERDESWEWENKEAEPPFLGEEEGEGFHELTWETPA